MILLRASPALLSKLDSLLVKYGLFLYFEDLIFSSNSSKSLYISAPTSSSHVEPTCHCHVSFFFFFFPTGAGHHDCLSIAREGQSELEPGTSTHGGQPEFGRSSGLAHGGRGRKGLPKLGLARRCGRSGRFARSLWEGRPARETRSAGGRAAGSRAREAHDGDGRAARSQARAALVGGADGAGAWCAKGSQSSASSSVWKQG